MTRPINAESLKRHFVTDTPLFAYDIVRGINIMIDNEPTLDVVPITFERFQFVCRFFSLGCDEDRQIELICRRKDMIPEGCSWGICDKGHCPYMKEEEE